MYLLGNQLISEYISNNPIVLDIRDFDPDHLQHTFYYFRLGAEGLINGSPYKLSHESGNNFLIILPNSYAIIKTYETFILSDRIMGIFGQSSDLIKEGAQLVHSPFIDPGFSGKLELGIKNISETTIILNYMTQIIGKISFFDVSDTGPLTISPQSKIWQKFEQRKIEKDDESLHSLQDEENDEF